LSFTIIKNAKGKTLGLTILLDIVYIHLKSWTAW